MFFNALQWNTKIDNRHSCDFRIMKFFDPTARFTSKQNLLKLCLSTFFAQMLNFIVTKFEQMIKKRAQKPKITLKNELSK